MRRYSFLLELAAHLAWFKAPKPQVEDEFDEETYLLQLTRLVVIALTIEGVIAIQVINFLWTHGQL